MHVKTDFLRAVLLAAPKADLRYYMNGVHVTATHLVATDGSRLHVVRHSPDGVYGDLVPFTIPHAAVTIALRGYKSAEIEITAFTLADKPFVPCEGEFPDWQRIMVKVPRGGICTAMQAVQTSCINPDFHKDAVKAIKLAGGAHGASCLLTLLPGDNKWVWSSPQLQVVVGAQNSIYFKPMLDGNP